MRFSQNIGAISKQKNPTISRIRFYFLGAAGLLPPFDVLGGLFPLFPPDGLPVVLGQFGFGLVPILVFFLVNAYYFLRLISACFDV